MRLIVAIVALMMVSGCAVKQIQDARAKSDRSQEQYRNCLVNNPKNLSKCDNLRLIYQLDRSDYETKYNHFQSSVGQMGKSSGPSPTDQSFELDQVNSKLRRIEVCQQTPQFCY